jgi:UDP-N-acetylglucosamine 2-epimerase (non-hydrolysing)
MKVMTVVGTRPELIRLSLIIPKLDRHCEHVFVHTGQNYDPNLKDVFFDELNIRKPDHELICTNSERSSQFNTIGNILADIEDVITEEKPDKFLVLGDTNSCLSAIVAKRMGVKVFHMEAGNRCYDDSVPEEVNRRIIDHSSDILLPYTEGSRRNLMAEGFPQRRIFVTGNPIFEVICNADLRPEILRTLSIEPKRYFLATIHRAENMNWAVLTSMFKGFRDLKRIYDNENIPFIISLHPRTRAAVKDYNINTDGLMILNPLGFNDFITLESNAFCVISDSGTVQEECCLFNVPSVTIRNTTERPETIECGSNIIGGRTYESLLSSVEIAVNMGNDWHAPKEYIMPTSDIVSKILLGVYP